MTAELLAGSCTTVVLADGVLLGLLKLNKSNSESKDDDLGVDFSRILGDFWSDFLATSFGLCLSLKEIRKIDIVGYFCNSWYKLKNSFNRGQKHTICFNVDDSQVKIDNSVLISHTK